MVWGLLDGPRIAQKVAVQVLGQIDDPSASRSLVMLAVFSGSPDVRRKAVETCAGAMHGNSPACLIAMIQKPIKYKVKTGWRTGPARRAVYLRGRIDAELETALFAAGRPSVALHRATGRQGRERSARRKQARSHERVRLY